MDIKRFKLRNSRCSSVATQYRSHHRLRTKTSNNEAQAGTTTSQAKITHIFFERPSK